jgi:hypothetical protein
MRQPATLVPHSPLSNRRILMGDKSPKNVGKQKKQQSAKKQQKPVPSVKK